MKTIQINNQSTGTQSTWRIKKMDTNDKATPRPWKKYHQINNIYLIDSGRTNLGSVDMKKEDVELAIKAVNNHDALLEACKEALNNLERLNDSGFGPVTDMASNKTYQLLSQAINQATK